MSFNSAIYQGTVFHARHVPKKHSFTYSMFMLWLDLDELLTLNKEVKGFSSQSFAPFQFKRQDYLPSNIELKDEVLARMSELNQQPLSGKVFLLCLPRTFGLYFSPVNFYYLQQGDGTFSHVLAEVSNTPWNERHCYFIDLANQTPCDKEFHVSPFNPMDMQYHWRVSQPSEKLNLSISCVKEQRHFDAKITFKRKELNSSSLKSVLISIPCITVKTVIGIYWQALKIFLKGIPYVPYPKSHNKDRQC